MKVAIATLGCKVNQYESAAIMSMFTKRGHEQVGFNESADIYIINTCTVTNLSDSKSRQLIRRAHRTNSAATVIACGCYAQTNPNEVAAVEGVNIIIGTSQRSEIVGLAESHARNVIAVSNIQEQKDFEELTTSVCGEGRTRAHVKIQDGCNRYCSYCIIPYARGPVRSRSLQSIEDEVKALAASEHGYKEIVLTGIHIASYGADLQCSGLLDVLKLANNVPGIERIRLGSLEPNIITRDFVQAITKIDKLCHHFHLSMQSGCDKILKLMNRRYTAGQYKDALLLLLNAFPDAAIWTDVIAGFPGEEDEDFVETMEFIKHSGLCRLHVFPFSPRVGTPAAKLDNQIDKAKKSARTKELISLSDKLYSDYLNKFVGDVRTVLFEKYLDGNNYEGHTSNYINVKVKSDSDLINSIRPATLLYNAPGTDSMVGEISRDAITVTNPL